MTKNDYYLGIARAVSKKSTCLKKHYGVVIVKNDTILSTGYNGSPRHEPHCSVCTKHTGNKDFDEYFSCPAVHAEMNAIISVSRNDMINADLDLAGFKVDNNKEVLEISAVPCEICLRLIKNTGINRIINNDGVIYERSNDGILRQIIEKEHCK